MTEDKNKKNSLTPKIEIQRLEVIKNKKRISLKFFPIEV